MPQVTFDKLPEHARLWVFAAERELDAEESDRLLAASDAFLDQWAAHGAPLTCGRDFRLARFLLVGVDERAAGVSGCSIDALVRTLKQLSADLGVALASIGFAANAANLSMHDPAENRCRRFPRRR